MAKKKVKKSFGSAPKGVPTRGKKDKARGKFEFEGDFDCNSWSGNGCKRTNTCGGCGYFLGFLGSAVYYVSSATSFWMGVVGVLKALVWPAFLVFEILKFLAA